jgi:sugar phosphate isomerase/epimerase
MRITLAAASRSAGSRLEKRSSKEREVSRHPMMDCHFELCVERLESAQVAEAGGADRIELCTGLSIGDLTPPFDLVRATIKSVSIPVHVLIRTRGGDFTPTEAEFDQMRREIEMAKQAGAAGVVLGIFAHGSPRGHRTDQRSCR